MNLNHRVSGMDLWLVWCLIAVNLSGTKWGKSDPFCHHIGRKAQHQEIKILCAALSKFCCAYAERITFLFTNNTLLKLAVTLLIILTVFRDKERWQLDYQKACSFNLFSNKVIWLMRPLFYCLIPITIKWKFSTRFEPEELIGLGFEHCTQAPETVDSCFKTSQSCR